MVCVLFMQCCWQGYFGNWWIYLCIWKYFQSIIFFCKYQKNFSKYWIIFFWNVPVSRVTNARMWHIWQRWIDNSSRNVMEFHHRIFHMKRIRPDNSNDPEHFIRCVIKAANFNQKVHNIDLQKLNNFIISLAKKIAHI